MNSTKHQLPATSFIPPQAARDRWRGWLPQILTTPLLLLMIFSLCLIFVSLINMCFNLFLFGFILYGTLQFLDLTDYFLSHIREVFDYNYFRPFLFLYPSGTNIMQMLMRLILSQKSLSESVLISFLFSLSYSVAVISTTLSPVHLFFCLSNSAINSF